MTCQDRAIIVRYPHSAAAGNLNRTHQNSVHYLSHCVLVFRKMNSALTKTFRALPTTNVPAERNSLTSPRRSKGRKTYKGLTLGPYQPATCLTSTDTALSTCLLVLRPLSSRYLPSLVLFLLQHSALSINMPHAVSLPLLMFVAFFVCGSY